MLHLFVFYKLEMEMVAKSDTDNWTVIYGEFNLYKYVFVVL